MAEAAGTVAAGLADDNRAAVLLAVVISLMGLTIGFVGMRLYVRHRMTNSLWWDDWSMLAALLITVFTGIDMCIMVRFGMGFHMAILTRQQVLDYFFGFYLSIVFYNAGLGVIKISLLLQYYRIFSTKMRQVTIASIVIVGLWCVALVLTSIFTCTPVEGFWNKEIESTCIPQLPQWYINAAGNIATDLFIFGLPIPVLWKLKLPLSQRLSLLGVFCIGFFTCTISVVRITFLNLGEDMTYENVGPAIWSIAELCGGIIGSCLPTLRPVFVRFFPVIGTSRDRTGSKAYGSKAGTVTHTSAKSYHTHTSASTLVVGTGTIVSASSDAEEQEPRRTTRNYFATTPEDYEKRVGLPSPRPPVPEKDYVYQGMDADDDAFGIQVPPTALRPPRPPRVPNINTQGGSDTGRAGVRAAFRGPRTPRTPIALVAPRWASPKSNHVKAEAMGRRF